MLACLLVVTVCFSAWIRPTDTDPGGRAGLGGALASLPPLSSLWAQEQGQAGMLGFAKALLLSVYDAAPLHAAQGALRLPRLAPLQPRGGLRDKPGKPADYYHTCYCLSGLASCQRHSGLVLGGPDNQLRR